MKALKVSLFILLALVVYYLTWTPSTNGISEKARIAVERIKKYCVSLQSCVRLKPKRYGK